MRDIFIPATGMARDDVVLETWLKQPGDRVVAGEVVAVVETSKTVLEVQAEVDGVLGDHLVAEEETVAPGTTIAQVLEAGDERGSTTTPDPAPVAPVAPVDAPSPPVPADTGGPAAPPGPDRQPHHLSPRARRIAAEQVAAPPAPGSDQSVDGGEPDLHRRAVAAAVSLSWRDVPHFAVTRELRLNRLVRAYRGARFVLPELTLTDLWLRAAALAFRSLDDHPSLDIGLAVATDRGVVIPVIPAVEQLDLPDLSAARAAAVRRARERRFDAADQIRPVTTLSNLGALGVDQFTGIVPAGQTTLITIGRLARRPVVRKGKVRPALTMHVTVNADHRRWDGQDAARLLDRLATVAAQPAVLLGLARPDTTVQEQR